MRKEEVQERKKLRKVNIKDISQKKSSTNIIFFNNACLAHDTSIF